MDQLGGLAPNGVTTIAAGKSITSTNVFTTGGAGVVLRMQVLDLPTDQIISDTKVTVS